VVFWLVQLRPHESYKEIGRGLWTTRMTPT